MRATSPVGWPPSRAAVRGWARPWPTSTPALACTSRCWTSTSPARDVAAELVALGVEAAAFHVDTGRRRVDSRRRGPGRRTIRWLRPPLRQRRRAAVRQHRRAHRRRLDVGPHGERARHRPYRRRVPAPAAATRRLASDRDHCVVGRVRAGRAARRVHHEQVRARGLRRDAAARARRRGHRRDPGVPGRNDDASLGEQRGRAPRGIGSVGAAARGRRGDAGEQPGDGGRHRRPPRRPFAGCCRSSSPTSPT